MKGALEAALDSKGFVEHRFPLNLETEVDHWVSFRANHPVFRKEQDFSKKNDLCRIFLPMPANVGTTYDHSYNTKAIGMQGNLAAGMSEAVGGGVDSIVNKLKSITKDKIADGSARASFDVAEGIATTAGLGNAFQGAVAAQGIAKNPYMAVMYDSPKIRSHDFKWKLIARNARESKILTDIVQAFKYHAAPGINQTNPHFFNYPEQFEIDFHYPRHTFNIGPSVMTSFNVQYHAEGRAIYHDISATEKAPVSVNISCNFQEVAIVTKKTIGHSDPNKRR